MNELKFVDPKHEILRKPTAEVNLDLILSDEIQTAIEGMLQIASGERGDLGKRIMVGLAAPQVGINFRIILVDVGVKETRDQLGDLRVYINPYIEWSSEEKELDREGCFSTGNVFGTVNRSIKVKIKAWDRWGNPIEEAHEGFTARIFQHEIDHLNGIRFPDRKEEVGCLYHVEREEVPLFHKQWREWTKKYSFSDWDAIKQ
jgi:peptide deformylase